MGKKSGIAQRLASTAKGGHGKITTNAPEKGNQPETPVSPSLSNSTLPLLFFMPNGLNGEFCQWYRASFAVTKGIIRELVGHPVDDGDTADDDDAALWFTCAEQFMMFCKAARFQDRESQQAILATPSPKEQKALGKMVRGFTNEDWDPVKSAVVVAGNVAKFGQNPGLKSKLLATGSRLLVEAASNDRVWGIGYSEKQAMAFRHDWGENRLGLALMDVRERLRREGEEPPKGG